MFNRKKKQYKETYKFYEKELSNFRTVMKDTNNNLVTAPQNMYNCMSYALGVFDNWLRIRAFKYSYTEDMEIDYECLNSVFCNCCSEIEENFSLRRLPNSKATLAADERLIAFRIGADDFHFTRQNSDGTWTHKPGDNYIREMSEDELFSGAWCEETRYYPYISAIAFYAVKI